MSLIVLVIMLGCSL